MIADQHPRLLIEWESPVRAFCSAIRPAFFSRSLRPLEVERAYTGVPGRAFAASTLLHVAFVLLGVSLIPLLFAQLQSTLPRDTREYRLSYLPTVVPEIEDTAGAEEGSSGAAGGSAAYYPAQVIRIARGHEQVAKVHDAPQIPLQQRDDSRLANLLVVPAAVPPTPDLGAMSLGRRPMHTPARVDVVQPMATAHVEPQARPKLTLPNAEIIPPPPDISSSTKYALPPAAVDVVPPPPNVSTASTKHPAVVAAPDVLRPRSVEQANATHPAEVRSDVTSKPGMVMSSLPGDTVGVPAGKQLGSLAMTPTGRGSTGAGVSGSGAGLSAGAGPGSGSAGAASGSGATGGGRGADVLARGGIIPGPGPGGSGSNTAAPKMVGISIRGGPAAQPGVIYLASFAPSAPNVGNSNPPAISQRTPEAPLGPRRQPAVTVISTPNAGGGLGKYGALMGPRVYTTYLETKIGTVVLEFSESREASDPGFDGDLTAPDPLNLHVPPDLAIARVIVACTIDRSGVLRTLRLLEAENVEIAAKVLAALNRWRFRPVLRRDVPVEVSAILGIHTGTR